MPRGARLPVPGRPQTLREARRAYQRAGRTPSMSAAQIRAAERAAEADRRATEIQVKERRAKEAKRRRTEQDARKREEQRMLVQAGRLPRDSLWGKVRASQQRLHNFFSARQRPEAADTGKATGLHSEVEPSGARASSNIALHTAAPDPRLGSPSAGAVPNARNNSPLPVNKASAKAKASKAARSIDLRPLAPEETVRVMAGGQAQPEALSSFPGTQLFSNFVDDADLEVELNGSSSSTKLSEDRSASNLDHDQTPPTQWPPRKRKVDGPSMSAPSCAKAARLVLGTISPTMLNTQRQDRVDILPNRSLTRLCLDAPNARLGPLDIPTASQVDALFGSQDPDDDGWHSDKENTNPRCAALNKEIDAGKTRVLDLIETGAHPSAISSVESPKQKKPPANGASSVPQGKRETLGSTNLLQDDSEDEFGDGVKDEILESVSDAFEIAGAISEMVPQSCGPKMSPIPTPSPRRLQVTKAIASPRESGDVRCCTQDSFYDLDGVDDEDLAVLADMPTSGQKGGSPTSPATRHGIQVTYGRTVLWATSDQLLRQDFAGSNFGRTEATIKHRRE